MSLARDLYLQCVEESPDYAPAWVRLGRMYHSWENSVTMRARMPSALHKPSTVPWLSILICPSPTISIRPWSATMAIVRKPCSGFWSGHAPAETIPNCLPV